MTPPYLDQAEVSYILAFLGSRLTELRSTEPSRHANESPADEGEHTLVGTLMLKLLASLGTDHAPVTQAHIKANELRPYDVVLWHENGEPYATVAALVPCAEHESCHLVSYVLNLADGKQRAWVAHASRPQAVARPRD